MDFFWEKIEEFVEAMPFEDINPGCLYQPIKEISVKRLSDLSLEITSRCAGDAQSERVEVPPGTVSDNDKTMSFENRLYRFECMGLGSSRVNTKYPQDTLTEHTIFHKFKITSKQKSEFSNTVEFALSNKSFFGMPNLSETTTSTSSTLAIGKNSAFVFELESKAESGSWNSILLNISGIELAIYESSKNYEDEEKVKLLFFYKGEVDKLLRNKIRNCVSYLLGQPIIYLGDAKVDKGLSTMEQTLVSPYTMHDAVFSVPSQPPAPLGTRTQKGITNQLDGELFNHSVNALFDVYDDIGFTHIYWLYWRARCLPFDMAIVFFSAALEYLEKTYSENCMPNRDTKALPKRQFKELLVKWKEIATEHLDGENLLLMERKLENLNSLPNSILSQRFFDNIGIHLSDLEISAWGKRNISAHGSTVKGDQVVEFIRANKLLKGILDRAVLSIIGTQEFYWDYYSLHFPIRLLNDPPV